MEGRRLCARVRTSIEVPGAGQQAGVVGHFQVGERAILMLLRQDREEADQE
jgi:hypothetical protein